jgi:hypothetical protein
MAKKMRNLLLLVKIQPTPNTDAAPTAAENSILARGVAPTPVNAEFEDRNLITPYLGHTGQVQTQSYSTIEFEVELAGAGAAGTAPKWGPLLRACSFAETVNAAVDVVYNPITNSQEAVTIHCFLDGIKHAMTDCKGTVSFQLNAKSIPVMRFAMTGFVATVTDAANPTDSDFTDFIAPLAINKQNTPTFNLHGIGVRATSLTIDMANQVDYRNYIAQEAVTLTERKPVGSSTFELDTMAVKNWYTAIRNGTLDTLELIHGTIAGNILEMSGPKVQVTSPSVSDDNGLAMFNVSLSLQPDAGNDELILTVR